jgi:CubicO group peptidase (beta-lactamase class C family)
MLIFQHMRLSLVAVCLTASAAPVMGQDLRARLDSAVPVLMRVGDVPGLEAAVVRDGQVVWSRVFGVRDAGTRAPVDRNTVFTAASLTKGVVTYAVLRLADRGELDLDAPIAAEVPNPDVAPRSAHPTDHPAHVAHPFQVTLAWYDGMRSEMRRSP